MSIVLNYTERIEPVRPLIRWFENTVIYKALHTSYITFIVYPLSQLYLRGFWSNLPMIDICAHLTSHRSDFWSQHFDECLLIVENNFDSWLVYALFILYLGMWIFFVRRCL